jgi:hypothetical protein
MIRVEFGGRVIFVGFRGGLGEMDTRSFLTRMVEIAGFVVRRDVQVRSVMTLVVAVGEERVILEEMGLTDRTDKANFLHSERVKEEGLVQINSEPT